MAKRKNSKRYPVQRKISVANTTGVPQPNGVISVSESLSKVNHRLYRFARDYDVSVTIDSNLADNTTIDVFALANTWWTQKATQLAKTAWDESNAEELKMLKGKKARWNDFRIHDGVATADILTPVQFLPNLTGTNFGAGEFDISSVVDQNGVTRTFTWSDAPIATEYSVMDEYDRSGNTNVDPTVPATGPYHGLLPNLEPGAALALQDDGNNPPYNANSYGHGIWVKVGTLHLGSGRQKLSTGFFTAPCGLIALLGVGGIGPDIQIEVRSGDYKGVRSTPMLE